MSSAKNVLGLGFIDLLAAFMIASVTLMIIIKYGTKQGSEIAGYPKDYILYTVEASFESPLSNLELEDLMFQFFVKTPQGDWLKSSVTSKGSTWTDNKGFIRFEGSDRANNFFGIGPSKIQGGDTVYFHIYGVEEAKPNEEWILGVRYYSNKKLEEGNLDLNSWNELINSKIYINHKLHYLGNIDTKGEDKILYLGKEAFKSIQYN